MSEKSPIKNDSLFRRILWKFDFGAPFFHCSYGPAKAGFNYDQQPHDGLNALTIGFGVDRLNLENEQIIKIWFTSPINWERTVMQSHKTKAFKSLIP